MARLTVRRLVCALASALLAACAASGPVTANGPATQTAPAAAVTLAPTLSLSITEAKYGSLAVRTESGARCGATLVIPAGMYGDVPPGALPEQIAGPDGLLAWTYSAPRVPAGTAGYAVTCNGALASQVKAGVFTIPTRPLVATSFTVRVTTEDPPQESLRAEPSLVPLRDATAAKMRATLAAEWRSATRNLGSLQIVETSADITIFVVAARGTSVHRSSPADDSQDVVVYVSGELGPRTVENNVAVALHELGHIWCCNGPDAREGHWLTKEASPGLYGVDKYGLMTDPVTCVSFGAILSCPNRFSDREMRALGFTSFPPPSPDPCITQSLSLRSQIDAARQTLASLSAQIRAIEAQYPISAPPSVYNTYVALISQYNTLNEQTNQKIAQFNALPCDSS